MRDNFTEKVKGTLAKRVNYHCSNPKCRKLTSGPNYDESKSTLIGIAAHISAASKGGPRFDETITPEQRKNITNGIWLCHNCSDLVDKNEKRFTSETLKGWKQLTEEFIQTQISSNENNSKSLFNELMEIMTQLNSDKKISELLPKIFEVSIIHNLTEINEICTREMNGWYASELPKLDDINIPEYRAYEVYISFRVYKASISGNATPSDFFRELEKQKDVFKLRYLFHEPIKEIEEYKTNFSKIEEKVMSEEIKENQLNFKGRLMEFESRIWFSSSIYNSIESGLRKELNRKIIEKIKKHST